MYKSREDTAWVLYQVTNCCDIIKSLQVNVDTINYKTYEQAVFVGVYIYLFLCPLLLFIEYVFRMSIDFWIRSMQPEIFSYFQRKGTFTNFKVKRTWYLENCLL